MDFASHYLEDARTVARIYKGLADGAIAQVDDEQFAASLGDEENSIALIIKHMAGNLRSRWTDFFTTDGEKPDRDRDSEFELTGTDDRAALLEAWEAGWATFLGVLDGLTPADFDRPVTIRGEPYTVLRAVERGVAHACYHVGQIVLLAKHFAGPEWRTLSIPRRQSQAFNADMAAKQGR
ncbi:DinB family protein [Longimicrobium sp.]|uniref:DinB family protein n=1 Tax=Longimicrobium sp. TaxID=2029185 RepID=UPI002E363E24|nr:DinB family protein [Longimicrobium sp.]HEX6038605.1 DinB family protein [Longimicrobium sp.]